jgi:hypothetical protein
MDVTFATEATPGRPNEDHLIATASFVIVIDGVTVPAGVRTGCMHDVPWLVRNLADLLVAGLSDDEHATLRAVTADAIRLLRRRHEATCDLINPDSPSATLAMLRRRGGELDYLVLCDSSVVLERHDGYEVITDDRTARLPAYDIASVARLRNASGGFWVASTDPRAAGEALAGTLPVDQVRRAVVLSDGAARYVERFGHTWADLFGLAERDGPRAVLEAVREAESAVAPGQRIRGKQFDDATLALCIFEASA